MITYSVDNTTDIFARLEKSFYSKWLKWYENVLIVIKRPKLELIERTRINHIIDFYNNNVDDMSLEYIDEQAEELYRLIAAKHADKIENGMTYIGDKRLFAVSIINRPNKLFLGVFTNELGSSRFPIYVLIVHRLLERLSALIGNKPGELFIYVAKLKKTVVECKNGAKIDVYKAYLDELARDKREKVKIEYNRRSTFIKF